MYLEQLVSFLQLPGLGLGKLDVLGEADQLRLQAVHFPLLPRQFLFCSLQRRGQVDDLLGILSFSPGRSRFFRKGCIWNCYLAVPISYRIFPKS